MSSESSSINSHSRSAQLGHCPLVFSNVIPEKEVTHWNPTHLASLAGDTKFNCRLHCRHCFQNPGSVQWEGDCYHVMSSVTEFLSWIKGRNNNGGEDPCLASYDPQIFWCYIDYKNLDSILQEKSASNKVIDWSHLGLVEEEPFQNYVWLGTQGAHTPCHYDTYGFNLVVQLYGSKRWILFPPEDSENLYPTRIPYEESSVYSEVNIKNPNLEKHPKFKNSHPHGIILKAGQVLYVPWKWWHFAECLEISLSINTWLQLPKDHASRVEEAVTRMIFSKWMTFSKNTDHWLNPNEDVESDEVNADYLSQTLFLLSEQSQSNQCFLDNIKSTEPKEENESLKYSQARSSIGSRSNHLENFLSFVERMLEKSPLQVTGLESSPAICKSLALNPELGDNPLQPSCCDLSTSEGDKDFVQEPKDVPNLKKQKLTNACKDHAVKDQQPFVQQLNPISVSKLLEHLDLSESQKQDPCPFHAKRESSSEKQIPPGPLPGELMEEELLKILLKPDVVALLAQNLQKRYTQELHERFKKN